MSILVLLGLSIQGAAASFSTIVEPENLYGSQIEFEVVRQGDVVGTHTVTFQRRNGSLVANTVFDLAIEVLFITAYQYRYQSSEIWQDGQLVSLDASVDDNGEVMNLSAQRTEQGLRVSRSDENYLGPETVFPTTHWNAGVLQSNQVLNTLTGNLDNVDILDLGVETVETRSGNVEARKYQYTGDLNVNVWYDADGRWVKLQFPGKDGTLIDYICVRCSG